MQKPPKSITVSQFHIFGNVIRLQKFMRTLLDLGMTPLDLANSVTAKFVPITFNGILVGWISPNTKREFVSKLRALKRTAAYSIPSFLEIAAMIDTDLKIFPQMGREKKNDNKEILDIFE